MSPGAVTVGRPKKTEKPTEPLKPKTVAIRATGEWAAWLERYAKHCRMDVAKTIDHSLAKAAKADGFNEPPPERIP